MVSARWPLALAVALVFVASACDLPRLEDQRERPLAQTSFIYASDGTGITELHATEDRVVLTADQMSPNVRDAVVAIEDRRFYVHGGIDLHSILRAAAVDLSRGEFVEGGSTITQQLVKNLYTGDASSLERKIDEAALALQMERTFSKDDILTTYLNTVYFGEGAYGVEAAAATFFGVHASELTLAQSAMLAGLITAPNHFDPFIRPDSAEGRRDVVLRKMREMGTITHEERREARLEPLDVARSDGTERYPFPYFVDYLKRWFLSNPAFGKTYDDRYRLLFTGGLRITTTLDPSIQKGAEYAVGQILRYPGRDPDAAVTVLDPRTGYVRAMVGGRDTHYWTDTNAGRVNLATDAGGSGRQTGSAFKAFALVAALSHGYSPDSTFAAPASITLPLPGGGTWHVTNADGHDYGTLSLRSATEESVNTVYAQLIQQLGADTVVRTAETAPTRRTRSRWQARTERSRPVDAASRPSPSNPSSVPTARSCGRRTRGPSRSSTHRWQRPPTTSCKTSSSTAPGRQRTSAGRRSARPGPTTTTTMRGSSAPSRSSRPRCGWGSTRARSRWNLHARGSRCSAAHGPRRSGAC
jgi:membrane peptidoglycan carboxypeptidase